MGPLGGGVGWFHFGIPTFWQWPMAPLDQFDPPARKTVKLKKLQEYNQKVICMGDGGSYCDRR